MSKGMWTKCLTAEGKAFYYNAAQNRSVWVPPSEAVVHEAPNLKFAPPDGDESAFAQPQPPQSAIINDQPTYVDEEAAQAARNDAISTDFQARIDAALALKQKEVAVKRFKKSEEELPEQQSAYLQQKSALERLSGSKGGESKWTVR